MEILDFLRYSFIQKAFIAGSFTAAACSVLGVFLVLHKMSLIGDGLSHVSFGALALGLFFGVYPFYIAAPVAVLGAYAILKITEKAKVYGDAAIGIVSAAGIAGGVILASISGGFNVDIFSYLFGNILSVSSAEVWLSVAISFVILLMLYFFYWDLFSAAFDGEYAATLGVKTNFVNTLLVCLTAVTVVLAVKTVGVMLVSALLILPAVTVLQAVKSFKAALLSAVIVSVTSVILGIVFALLFNLPAGAAIVMVNLLFFAIAVLYRRVV